MPQLATLLPVRRPEVVSWRAGNNGHYLIRNRKTGESFRVGAEEHFLLNRLDGGHSAEQVCAAFAGQFGSPLSDEDLEEFLDLAQQRGFLQPEGAAEPVSASHTVCTKNTTTDFTDNTDQKHQQGFLASVSSVLSVVKLRQAGSRALAAVAAALHWLASLLQAAGLRIHWLRLSRFGYVPRPDDVFIVTYPRSGTTWMQMILYQLTTDGAMDFPHIAEYCPWFERSLRSGLGFETRPSPRIFKSHLRYRAIPKGPGKYIYVARAGKDVAVSCYHLHRRYNGYEGTFADFFAQFLRGRVEFGSWFEHVKGWWMHRSDPNVLFLTYEELTSDLEKCIRRIIDFCGFEVASERLPAIVERCSFAFMKKHESQFDPALETLWEQGVQLNAFLRNGRVGEGAVQLSSAQEARFDEALRRLRRSGFPA